MRHPTAVADAAPAEAPVPYATRPVPPLDSVLARMDRAGAGALDDHELLALVGVDAATLAAAGGLRGVLDDPADRLCAVLLTREDRARVHAVLELHARWMESRLKREGPFTSPAHTSRYVVARLRGRANEVFAVVFLDNRHRVIAFEELFHGTVDGASVHPRVVVARRALALNAAALVACHNHPSGVAEPSLADRAISTASARDPTRQGIGTDRAGTARRIPANAMQSTAPRGRIARPGRAWGS